MGNLNLRQLKHLAAAVDLTVAQVECIADNVEQHVEEFLLIDPRRPEKHRIVINARRELRAFQSRLHRRLLVPKLNPSPYSHGGVRTKSIKTNAAPHVKSSFVLKLDIESFYPSIHHSRLYRLLSDRLGCSPDVARLITRICTYRNHLALGLVTSPIFADQVLKRIDRRIDGICKDAGLTYTRFVDDVTISGPFDLENDSAISQLIERILRQDGFRVNSNKRLFSRLDGSVDITGIALRRGKMDVSRSFLDELVRQLDDAMHLAQGRELEGPYYTREQLLGRVHYASWIAPGRRQALQRKFRRIAWSRAAANAQIRGYLVCKPRLVPAPKTP